MAMDMGMEDMAMGMVDMVMDMDMVVTVDG